MNRHLHRHVYQSVVNDRPSLALSLFMVKLCEIVKNSDEYVQFKIRLVLDCILKVETGENNFTNAIGVIKRVLTKVNAFSYIKGHI